MKTKIIKIIFAFVITLASFNAFSPTGYAACSSENPPPPDPDPFESMPSTLGE